MFLNNGGIIDTDRQWLHVSNSVRITIIQFDANAIHCNQFNRFLVLIKRSGFATGGNNATTRDTRQIQSETPMDHSVRLFITLNSHCVYTQN